ncbi:MAG: histidinol-phosphatase HisJ family protein [Selenomonadaceae bacterium]|nr:histidinol-phosphatase HisJ family protein [Selenomonadaceae bacterium]
MKYDNHIHTKFSSDSTMEAVDALKRAKELNLALVFTEHIDLGMLKEGDFTFDAKAYFNEYEKYRGKNLSLGVEVGLTKEHIEDNIAFVKSAPFDQIIGSVHILRGVDLYPPDIYSTREKKELYSDYLLQMAHLVYHNPYINILGHIDYIARYATYEDPGLLYDDFAEEIDEVLRALITADTVFELNTRRLSKETAAELLPIYKRYRELGGRYATIGSDAHNVENIGKNYDIAENLLEAAKLTAVTFYEGRMEISK